MDHEGEGVGLGCVIEIATIPAAERNASSLSSAVGVVVRFETAFTALASVTTESSSSPLFSVVDAVPDAAHPPEEITPPNQTTKMPCTHATPMHRCHARRGLPVNQNTNLTPPTQAPFELHHTAAAAQALQVPWGMSMNCGLYPRIYT